MRHIQFNADTGELCLLDQRKLPLKEEFLLCRTYKDVITAIQTLAVRGAPAIGVAAAWGCRLAAQEALNQQDPKAFLQKALAELRNARPTAVNLGWAIERMQRLGGDHTPMELTDIWQKEADQIQREDEAICQRIGQMGAALIRNGDVILTHCNAGALATAGYGTALGVIRAAREQGKSVSVIADETRPLLQGSRLTAFEMAAANIPVTVICDNACAMLMSQGAIQIVITGADRIAANGDTANKIGTLGVAILAAYYHIPFYIAAPLSTIDLAAKNGAAIPIEERSPEEVLTFNGARTAPKKANAKNFAFDVTPAKLIAGIITEVGVLRAPYEISIANAFGTANE